MIIALVLCFGYTLFELVKEANTLIEANSPVDQKWKDLIKGEIVTLENGQKKRWKGLIVRNESQWI